MKAVGHHRTFIFQCPRLGKVSKNGGNNSNENLLLYISATTKARQLADGILQPLMKKFVRYPTLLQMQVMHVKTSCGPVCLAVDAAYKGSLPQNGQTEIAVLALSRRHIAFKPVLKVEYLHQTFTMNHGIVKGR